MRPTEFLEEYYEKKKQDTQLPKQENLYTDEQVIGFADWLGLNEYRYSRKYKCYQKMLINETIFFTTKELFEKYIQSLKTKKD
jgi:hypothetical protein